MKQWLGGLFVVSVVGSGLLYFLGQSEDRFLLPPGSIQLVPEMPARSRAAFDVFVKLDQKPDYLVTGPRSRASLESILIDASGTPAIALPNREPVALHSLTRAKDNVWTATIEPFGRATLLLGEEGLTGYLSVGSDWFRIHALHEGWHVIVHDTFSPPTDFAILPPSCPTSACPTDTTLSIVVAADKDTVDRLGWYSWTQQVDASIQGIDDTLRDAGATIAVVGFAGAVDTQGQRFQTPVDALAWAEASSAVNNLLTTHGADVAVLSLPVNVALSSGRAGDRVAVIADIFFYNFWEHTLVHEFGHLVQANHEDEASSACADHSARAYMHPTGDFRTLMATSEPCKNTTACKKDSYNCCARQRRFSDPNVLTWSPTRQKDVPMGLETANNAAAVVNGARYAAMHACAIAAP
jgi:hypothetical protein